tara:strand:- start:33156 stop:34079 length:924 start_codon:yes stop_codon:yes gene_type:complete
LRILLILALTACTPFVASEPVPQSPPAALPGILHGHRIERVPAGYLCFGGFHRGAALDRGARMTTLLSPGSDAWQECSPLNYPHSFFASACIDDTAYAIGAALEKFDAAANAWQTVIAPGQLPRSHFGAAALGNEIFVLGGFPRVGTGFLIANVDAATVRAAKPPPSFTHGDHLHFVCALHDELHVWGGIDGDDSEMHTAHWVRRSGDWHALPDCPKGMWTKFAAYAVHDGALYVFGEFGGWRYDPLGGGWQPRAKMPESVAMPAAVASNGSIWVLGGMQSKGRGSVFFRYDIASNRWTAPKPERIP